MLNVIIASLVGGLLSLIGGVLLLSNQKATKAMTKYATPFAAGALISTAILELLHEALELRIDAELDVLPVLYGLSFGILCFFVLERFLHFFHHHDDHDDIKTKSTNSLIVVGDSLHNALDGVAIAAAFLVSTELGVVTTLAIALHEIPQEIGDFALLLRNGYSRRKTLIANIVSSLATVLAAGYL
jgi:zinc and cadmium transporter